VPYALGGKNEPFWVALKRAMDFNSEPWNWRAMFANFGGSKDYCTWLVNNAAHMCTFPIYGVMAGVQRSDIHWMTVKEYNPNAPATPIAGPAAEQTEPAPPLPHVGA
jgi:hypothetical protein